MMDSAAPIGTRPVERATASRARLLRRRLRQIWPHVLLIGLAVIFLVPFYWMVISAFKTKETMFTYPVEWLPRKWNWQNFATAMNYPNFPFLKFLWNSAYYAVLSTIGTVCSCAMVGYAFARLRFPGRQALFFITIATLMIPWVVTFIPTFILFKNMDDFTTRYLGFKTLGTYLPLIIPTFGGNAFYIFLRSMGRANSGRSGRSCCRWSNRR
jgi:multiple sugar transport system permease protein